MKTIYVLNDRFSGYKGITEEEAKQGIAKKEFVGFELIMDRGGDENPDEIKIVLLESSCWYFFGMSDEQIEQCTKAYFDYVESITGMVTYPKP